MPGIRRPVLELRAAGLPEANAATCAGLPLEAAMPELVDKSVQTTWPHRMFLAASAAPDHLRNTLKNAAQNHALFTDALLRFSKLIV